MNKNFYDVPDYINEFVIFFKDGLFQVIDCESYHLSEFDNVIFVDQSYEVCREYVIRMDSRVVNYLNRIKIPFFVRWVIKAILRLSKYKIPKYNLRVSEDNYVDKLDSDSLSTDNNSTSIYYAGWMRIFQSLSVGDHPVFEFTKFPPEGFNFIRNPIKVSRKVKVKRLKSLLRCIVKYSFLFHKNGVGWGDILRFWLTRELSGETCSIKPGMNTIVMYPSFLLLCPNHKWIIEIEDMLTMMMPFVANGSTNPGLGKNHPIVKMIGVMISQPECGAILCHLKQTADGLKKLFSDYPGSERKIIHITLGAPLGEQIIRPKKAQGELVKILFMSGWSQSSQATYRRGLLNTLEICKKLKQKGVRFQLTIRSSLPHLSSEFAEVLEYNEVDVISNKISKIELDGLYRSHDILLFPAPRLAVTTLLTGMANSMAIIGSDGFGIEEYVVDGENGFVARGYGDEPGWIDDEGVFRENYCSALKVNDEVCTNAVKYIEQLINDSERLYEYQMKSRKYAEQHYSIENWNRHFADKMRDLL